MIPPICVEKIAMDTEPMLSIPSPLSKCTDNEVVVINDFDIDTSSNCSEFFPIIENNSLQPDLTHSKKVTLAELAGARTIFPIPTTPPPILSEKVKATCLAELSNPHTFLSDVTVNSFCVSH